TLGALCRIVATPIGVACVICKNCAARSRGLVNKSVSVRPAMALSAKLVMRQSQSMVMTPQLLQAIKLLQLPNMELAAYIENELERNPLLERAEDREQAEAVEEPGP